MTRTAITNPDPTILANVAAATGVTDPKILKKLAIVAEKARARETAKAERKAARDVIRADEKRKKAEARAAKRAERKAARDAKDAEKNAEKRAKDEARKAANAIKDAARARALFFVNLAPHVSDDPDRPALRWIKVDAKFGYATNGHVLVRLPTPEGVPPGMYAKVDEKEDAKLAAKARDSEAYREKLAAFPRFGDWRQGDYDFAFPDVEKVIPSAGLEARSIRVEYPEALVALRASQSLKLRVGDRFDGASIEATFGIKVPVGTDVMIEVKEPTGIFKFLDIPKSVATFGINPRYLIDAADSLGLVRRVTKKAGKTQTTHLTAFDIHGLTDELGPIVLHAIDATEDGRRGLAVIMPMRV
jgi:hypothetical protein